MDFWGVEVKPGETVKCEPGEKRLLHLSQAALGESKEKGAANIPLYVKFKNQKLVLGTLHAEKCAQISYDLVFEKEFELSHGSKIASVYFCGYKSDHPEDDSPSDDEFPEFDSEEEELPVANGAKAKAQGEKSTAKSNVKKDEKPKAKTVEPVKAEQKADDEDDDDEDEDDSDDDFEGSDGDEGMMEAMGDSDDDEDSEDDEEDESSEEDEATPKNSANGKKRQVESASKTPVPEKKAKLSTPAGKQKTGDGKKSGHVATPYPSKQAAKTPANSDKAKQQQSPKSAGSVTCKSCSKGFKNENALEAHTKAKHSGK